MAGNGVVLKPSPHAALAASGSRAIFTRAGLPEGLLRVVHGHAEIGGALVESPVAQVRFTGGAARRRLGRRGLRAGAQAQRPRARRRRRDARARRRQRRRAPRAARRGRRSPTPGSPAAASGARSACTSRTTASSTRSSRRPRRCTSATRRTRRRRSARSSRASGSSGCDALVDDALEHGATLHCGGPVAIEGKSGAFFAPAVLTGVEPVMQLWREEAPGPVLVVHEAPQRGGGDPRSPTRRRSGSAPRSGRPTSTRARASRASSRPGWSG